MTRRRAMGPRVPGRAWTIGALAGGIVLTAATAWGGTGGIPGGGQVTDDPAAGIDPSLAVGVGSPAGADVAGGSLSTGSAAAPWAIFEQTRGGGGADQIFVRSFAHGRWTTRGHGTVGGRSS